MANTPRTTARRVTVVAITAAIALVACGPTPPTTPPSATALTASPAPTASPDAALHLADPAYLAGDAFSVRVGDAGADWTAPSSAPVLSDGQLATRVAFLPATCAVGDFTLAVDPAPADTWERTLNEDGNKQGYQFMAWPAAQIPECSTGTGRGYLQVAYHPFAPLRTIHLVASLTSAGGAPTAVEVVPVFTEADATQPSLTMPDSNALDRQPGPDQARSATAQRLYDTEFLKMTLPDGSSPTRWGLKVTGCGSVGTRSMVITARVGGGPPVPVGECSGGSLSNDEMALPVPADGTEIEVLLAGGTTRTQVRISEFQWRGDR